MDLAQALLEDPSPLEQIILKAVNAYRQTQALPPMVWDEQVAIAARTHARDLVLRGDLYRERLGPFPYNYHDTPEGLTPADRVRLAGASCSTVEELILIYPFQGRYAPPPLDQALRRLASQMVNQWINSTSHRDILVDFPSALLYQDYADTAGVGVAVQEREGGLVLYAVLDKCYE